MTTDVAETLTKLTNGMVRKDGEAGFATFKRYYSAFTKKYDGAGRLVLEWNSESPAVTLQSKEELSAFTRKDFQDAFKTDASEDLVRRAESHFGVDIESFRQNHVTVGAGAMVFLKFKDGIFLPMVERTAAAVTPGGVPNPGTLSRPAGGIIGDIEETMLREVSEELILGASNNHGRTILHARLVPDQSDLPKKFIEDALKVTDEKGKLQLAAKFNRRAFDKNDVSFVDLRIPYHTFNVPGLTEEVVQKMDGVEKVLDKVTYFDSKGNNGDVDSLVCADMSLFSSRDFYVMDGETGMKGELLNRNWAFYKPQQLVDRLEQGRAFSPLPKKVIAHMPAVMRALHRLDI